MSNDDSRRYGLFNLYDRNWERIAKEMTTTELARAGLIPKGISLGEIAERGGRYRGMTVERVAELTINEYRAHVLRKQGHKIPDYVIPWMHCYKAGKEYGGFTLEGLVYFCGLRKWYYDVYLNSGGRTA